MRGPCTQRRKLMMYIMCHIKRVNFVAKCTIQPLPQHMKQASDPVGDSLFPFLMPNNNKNSKFLIKFRILRFPNTGKYWTGFCFNQHKLILNCYTGIVAKLLCSLIQLLYVDHIYIICMLRWLFVMHISVVQHYLSSALYCY